MADKVGVAVLISGRGSNMLALAEHKRRDPSRPYEIVLVASNVPDARGLVLAKRLGISTNTVHTYVVTLYRRFGVGSRSELLAQFVDRRSF